jgi:uncharacterized protein YjiS (DUF1127 family)
VLAFLPTEEDQMQFGSLRRAAAELGEQPDLIDALLVRALAGSKALLRRIAEWQRRSAERRELMMLTDRDLRDIRITRSEANAEANKPFWET